MSNPYLRAAIREHAAQSPAPASVETAVPPAKKAAPRKRAAKKSAAKKAVAPKTPAPDNGPEKADASAAQSDTTSAP